MWRLLIYIVHQKVIDHKRWESRHKREDRTYGGTLSKSYPVWSPPEPLAELEDQRIFLFESLRDDELRKIAAAKLEGYSNPEIAELLGVSPGQSSGKSS